MEPYKSLDWQNAGDGNGSKIIIIYVCIFHLSRILFGRAMLRQHQRHRHDQFNVFFSIDTRRAAPTDETVKLCVKSTNIICCYIITFSHLICATLSSDTLFIHNERCQRNWRKQPSRNWWMKSLCAACARARARIDRKYAQCKTVECSTDFALMSGIENA